MPKFFLLAFLLAAPTNTVILTTSTTGIAASDLADTPLSLSINMQAGVRTNQLDLTLAVTAGTSTRVRVTCYDSVDDSVFAQMIFCDSASPSACFPDVREFTLSDFSAVGGVIYIPSRWAVTKQYVKCSVDDPDDGTGTVSLTGARSWQ